MRGFRRYRVIFQKFYKQLILLRSNKELLRQGDMMNYNPIDITTLPPTIGAGAELDSCAYAHPTNAPTIHLEGRVGVLHTRAQEEARMFSGIVGLMSTLENNPQVHDLFIAHYRSDAPTLQKAKTFREALMDLPGVPIKHKFSFDEELLNYASLWESYASLLHHDSPEPQGSYVEHLTRFVHSKVDTRYNQGRVETEFPEFHFAVLQSTFPIPGDMNRKV